MSDDSFSVSQFINSLSEIIDQNIAECKILQSDGKTIVGISVVRSVKGLIAIKLITDIREMGHE